MQSYATTHNLNFFIYLTVVFQRSGQAVPSFTSRLLSEVESTIKDSDKATDEIETIKNCAGLAYAGTRRLMLRLTELTISMQYQLVPKA